MKLTRVGHVEDNAQDWAIDGVLSGVSLLWGESAVGKSFVAVSMAASVGSNRPWIGRKTHGGRVVYVAGEGGLANVDRRLRAALLEWTVDPQEAEEEVPVDIVTPGAILTSKPGLEELRGLIGDQEAPKLIVVDTLARCFEGDENKQEFMGAFVRSLDALRDEYSCAVLVIHHANRANTIRGSSALTGAVDVSWKLTKCPGPNSESNGRVLIMEADKLRERDTDQARIRLRVTAVHCKDVEGNWELDEFGDRQTSLVIKPTKEQLLHAKRLQEAIEEVGGKFSYTDWRNAVKLEKSKFDAALSTVLTYPGQWGKVEVVAPGMFAIKSVEDVEEVSEVININNPSVEEAEWKALREKLGVT